MIKMMPVIVASVVMLGAGGGVASEPRTSADLYIRSYTEQMRQGASRTSADIRAEQYSRMYEFCDADHNCVAERNIAVPGVAEGSVVAIQSVLA